MFYYCISVVFLLKEVIRKAVFLCSLRFGLFLILLISRFGFEDGIWVQLLQFLVFAYLFFSFIFYFFLEETE